MFCEITTCEFYRGNFFLLNYIFIYISDLSPQACIIILFDNVRWFFFIVKRSDKANVRGSTLLMWCKFLSVYQIVGFPPNLEYVTQITNVNYTFQKRQLPSQYLYHLCIFFFTTFFICKSSWICKSLALPYYSTMFDDVF